MHTAAVQPPRRRSAARRRNGKPFSWIPYLFVAGFVVVAVANAVLIYEASHSSTGLVTDRAYEAGLAYNRVIARAAAEDALGWTGSVDLDPTWNGDGAMRILATVTDAQGREIPGLAVTARLVRPVEPDEPIEVALTGIGGCRYAAPVTLPRRGQWQIAATARRGGDVFDFGKRVFVP